MADNEDNANMDQENQVNIDAPANVIPYFVIPGELEYELPEDEIVEEPFDPITIFAIRESGRTGPLNEAQLKALLQKLDRRLRGLGSIVNVAQRLNPDVHGIIGQLIKLSQRISEIEIMEEYRTDILKGRIKEVIKAIESHKNLNPIHPLRLTISAKKAFESVGGEGPLNRADLENIVYAGNYNMVIPQQEVIEQMKDIISSLKYEEEIRNLHFSHVCKKIRKASKDLIKEFMTLII